MLTSFWSGLGRASRIGFVAGLVLLLAAVAAAAWWTLHARDELLFSDLAPVDAAAMTRELEQMKQPYRLGEDGRSILVEQGTAHATRLKLMSRELPLHGAVGFELFNNTDFGMTEFAQRINYQRALQGEITRTILSLAEVESARVHIALAEDGLFKQEQSRAKASVTLGLRHGLTLRRDQVAGIQRLVAAAVPGIQREDVTIVNPQGVALSPADDETGTASHRLELARDIEQHLVRKATAVLDRAFGPGQSMASVDVTLDMNQVRTTTEDVVTPPGGEAGVGAVLRERETMRDTPMPARGSDGVIDAAVTQREVDYQLGRRVQQVVSSPGAIARLQVVVVLRPAVPPARLEQVKALVGAAVGLSRERGDTVVVQSLDGLVQAASLATPTPAPAAMPTAAMPTATTMTAPSATSAAAGPAAASTPSAAALPAEARLDDPDAAAMPSTPARPGWRDGLAAGPMARDLGPAGVAVLVAAMAVVLVLALAAAARALRHRGRAPVALTPAQRDASLQRVREWLAQDAALAGPRGLER